MRKEIRIDSETTTGFVSVADVKAWGKIKSDSEDDLIQTMIDSVRQLQEQWTGRAFVLKTITAQWDKLPEDVLLLPYGPIRSITSIKRVYSDGTLSDALTEGTDYYISGMDFKKVNLYSRWTSAGKTLTGIRAAYTCGHGTGSGLVALPTPIKTAVMRHVTTDFDMRDDLEVYTPVLYDWTKEALQPYKIDNLWL